jgi:hypothetical protein
MADEQAAGPDGTAVRVALWRAMQGSVALLLATT